MSDIFDEILAASDSFRPPLSAPPTPVAPTPFPDKTHVPPISIPSMPPNSTSPQSYDNTNAPVSMPPHMSSYMPAPSPPLIPSPRGIQDAQSPYAASIQHPYSVHASNPHNQSDHFMSYPPSTHQTPFFDTKPDHFNHPARLTLTPSPVDHSVSHPQHALTDVPDVADIPVVDITSAPGAQTYYPSDDDASPTIPLPFNVHLNMHRNNHTHPRHPNQNTFNHNHQSATQTHPPSQYFAHNQPRHPPQSPPPTADVPTPQMEQSGMSLSPDPIPDSQVNSTWLSVPQSVTAVTATTSSSPGKRLAQMTIHDNNLRPSNDAFHGPHLKRSRSDTTATAASGDIDATHNDEPSHLRQHARAVGSDHSLVKSEHMKTEPNMVSVMQPSAKTILERRAKAMREGRRKDAKLTEAERRIVRRLRNRESAERCRLRRVHQAAMMEQRMVHMQQENERLVAEAESYRKAISHYQSIIANFSHRATSQGGTACVPVADTGVAASQGLCEQLVGGANN